MDLLWKRAYIALTRTFSESKDQVRDKSESKYQRVQDKSEMIEKCLESGLEYYSPTWTTLQWSAPRKHSTAVPKSPMGETGESRKAALSAWVLTRFDQEEHIYDLNMLKLGMFME